MEIWLSGGGPNHLLGHERVNLERGLRPYPMDPLASNGGITVIIPGVNDDELCESGECSGCQSVVVSNRKFIYCPYCGVAVGLS